MLVSEFVQPIDEKQVWGRKGKTLVRKYRCMSGNRKNRIVATPAQCFAPLIKRAVMKRTRARPNRMPGKQNVQNVQPAID